MKKVHDQEWYLERKSKIQENYRKWYSKPENKALAIARAFKYNQKLKEEYPEKFKDASRRRSKKWSQTPAGIYLAIKNHSKKRKMPCLISKQDFINWHTIQEKICYYCGKPELSKRLSIDRKDNNLPYQLGNIVLACDDCNKVKSNILSEEEMLIVGKIVMRKRWEKQQYL